MMRYSLDLFKSTLKGDLAGMKALIESDPASVDEPQGANGEDGFTYNGCTAIFAAIFKGNVAALQLLLASGADANWMTWPVRCGN